MYDALAYFTAHALDGAGTQQDQNSQQGSGMFRPEGHPYRVGREQHPLVREGEGIGQFIDDQVPGGHTFGTNHDAFVGYMTEQLGWPDQIVNIPSMGLIFMLSLQQEIINSTVNLTNSTFNTNFNIPLEHTHEVEGN